MSDAKTLGDKVIDYVLNNEIRRLRDINKDLLEACEAARLTYKALERNHKIIIQALQAKGWPSNWLTQEIEKAAKVEAAISKAEGR